MALLRLFLLAALIYLLIYLVRSIFKAKVVKIDEGSQETEEVEDILVEDPTCHKLVPKKQAIRLRKAGKTVYFCSEECCDAYDKKMEE
ncbi:MAG: hypothetical protein OCC45_04220 [Desulfotalea sp.]